jgi:hypothetical protein
MERRMDGREFLRVARDLMNFNSEPHRRGAAVHSYYAILLECRDVLERWGLPPAPRYNVHGHVRLKFARATDADLRQIGDVLDQLNQLRNRASYDLSQQPLFASSARIHRALLDAAAAVKLLTQIDADSSRRTAAIAALPP